MSTSQDQRLLADLESRHGRANLEKRMTQITHGLDYVNVSSVYFVAHDLGTVDAWRDGLNRLLRNVRVNHISPMTALQKQ